MSRNYNSTNLFVGNTSDDYLFQYYNSWLDFGVGTKVGILWVGFSINVLESEILYVQLLLKVDMTNDFT